MSDLPAKRGNDGRYLPTVQFQQLEQDDNKRDIISKTINNILAINQAFDEPVKSDEEMCDRLNWFFKNCADTRQLATVEKMCLALGMPRETVYEIMNGIKPGFTRETSNILKKAKDFIASIDAELAQEGRIQPVVYLFRAKNYYGMKDQQEMVLTPNNRLGDYQDESTIRQKYAELPEPD